MLDERLLGEGTPRAMRCQIAGWLPTMTAPASRSRCGS